MSELKTNKITSQDSSRKLTINSGLEINSGVKKVFEVTDSGDTIITGALLLGSQGGATHGGSLQMVTSNGGPSNSLSWTTYSYSGCANIDAGVPADVITEYLIVGFYDGCSQNTVAPPTPPAGYAFCDGDNGTPDLRSQTNPLTGLRDFEGNCGGANSYLSGVWTKYYIIKL